MRGDMSRTILIVQPDEDRPIIHGAGDEYRLVAGGEATDGAYCLFEAIVPPDAGPPPHMQTREEELFYVLEGEITFYGEEGATVAPAGSMVNIPKGAPHRFHNETDTTARMLMLFSPAGIEEMFFDMIDIDDDDLPALGEAAAKYGVRFLDAP